jgi:hypothetical protein
VRKCRTFSSPTVFLHGPEYVLSVPKSAVGWLVVDFVVLCGKLTCHNLTSPSKSPGTYVLTMCVWLISFDTLNVLTLTLG